MRGGAVRINAPGARTPFAQGPTQPYTTLQAIALSALYSATDGDTGWTSTNWMAGEPCTNSWRGVDCSGDRVGDLEMDGFGLTGTLPTQIGYLTSWTSDFQMEDNQFTGDITHTHMSSHIAPSFPHPPSSVREGSTKYERCRKSMCACELCVVL